MKKPSRYAWPGVTVLLTLLIMIAVFPVLSARFGLVAAVLLSPVLILGMFLYYLRGILFSRFRR